MLPTAHQTHEQNSTPPLPAEHDEPDVMHENTSAIEYDYAVVRTVPRVHRGEFLNVGVILHSRRALTLLMRVSIDEARLRALDPGINLDLLRSTLRAWEQVARGGRDAGPIGLLTPSERFHWLTAPRSSILQTSPVHPGRCHDLDAAIEELMKEQVGC